MQEMRAKILLLKLIKFGQNIGIWANLIRFRRKFGKSDQI